MHSYPAPSLGAVGNNGPNGLCVVFDSKTRVSFKLIDDAVVIRNQLGENVVPVFRVKATVLVDVCRQELLQIPNLDPLPDARVLKQHSSGDNSIGDSHDNRMEPMGKVRLALFDEQIRRCGSAVYGGVIDDEVSLATRLVIGIGSSVYLNRRHQKL